MDEQDLETALTASIQSRVRLLLEAEVEHENENLPDALEKQIQECQTAISRCKAKQADAFEDYAEGALRGRNTSPVKQKRPDSMMI